MTQFDGWELPIKCISCGRQDNHEKDFPTTFLDIETKLCEFCFGDKFDEDNL